MSIVVQVIDGWEKESAARGGPGVVEVERLVSAAEGVAGPAEQFAIEPGTSMGLKLIEVASDAGDAGEVVGFEADDVEGGDESRVEGVGWSAIGSHAGFIEEGVDVSHGGDGFGEGGGGGLEGVSDEADGEAEAAPARVDDDAADASQFVVEHGGAGSAGDP